MYTNKEKEIILSILDEIEMLNETIKEIDLQEHKNNTNIYYFLDLLHSVLSICKYNKDIYNIFIDFIKDSYDYIIKIEENKE